MPIRSPNTASSSSWPELEDSYIDEYGPIDRGVYKLVPRVWPIAVPLILRTLQDLQTGQRLMMNAVAIVSRKVKEEPERITNLHGYLFRTFSHLVSEEFEKEIKHARLGLAHTQAQATAERSDDEIYRAILLHEVLTRADQWTREVLELRILGHTFEEIGERFEMKGNHVRSRWSKAMAKLSEIIRLETKAAERRILHRDRF